MPKFKENNIVVLNDSSYEGTFKVTSPHAIAFNNEEREACLVTVIAPTDIDSFASHFMCAEPKKDILEYEISVCPSQIRLVGYE